MYVKHFVPIIMAISAFLFSSAVSVAAQTRALTDDLGRAVPLPSQPQRIAVLHDKNLTIPLLELGVMPVGSHGRTDVDGAPFIRSAQTITGYDFNTTPIQFLGSNPVDLEKIAATKPDLILTSPWQKAGLVQLSDIAPTFVIDTTARGPTGVFDVLAKIVGRQDRLHVMEARYQAQLNQLRKTVPTRDITVNVLQGVSGGFFAQHTYSTLGKVLRDAGFKFPEIVDDIEPGRTVVLNAEMLQHLDADVLFLTYRIDQGQGPQDAIDAISAVFPGWCRFSTACQEGQLVFLPREEATAASYDAQMALVLVILAATSQFAVTVDHIP